MKTRELINYLFIMVLIFQSCQYDNDSFDNLSDTGKGGSMARFTTVGDNLFTVDRTNLKVFDISEDSLPKHMANINVGLDVETIFPFEDKLFLGSETGMYIYDVSTPQSPLEVSFYQHVVSCDPVVSDGKFAYVTLNSFSENCWHSVNELQIVDLTELSRPKLIAQYPMTNPRGMALRNDTLWVCDNGLRIFNVKEKTNIVELFHFDNLIAYDVIWDKNRAIVIGETGFVQYKLEGDTIRKLSEINVEL